MKAQIPTQDGQTPHQKSLTNSFSEIALIVGYFLTVRWIPNGWLDSALGAMARAIAEKINPYLSPYSIAFSESPFYFIHCHVLATFFFIPWGFVLIVMRNGGINGWQKVLAAHVEKKGDSIFLYWFKLSIFLVPLIYSMLWLVGYPFGSAAYATWISRTGIPISAFMLAYLISIYLGMSYTLARLFLIDYLGGNK